MPYLQDTRTIAEHLGNDASPLARSISGLGRVLLSLLASGLIATLTAGAAYGGTTIVDFESVATPQSNAFGSFYNGADGQGGFEQHGVKFTNQFTDFGQFTVWSGWAASRSVDTTTAGFTNQYSVLAGGGVSGNSPSGGDPASAFGVAFVEGDNTAAIELPSVSRVVGMAISNTTYTGLSMRDGDAFAKKFGGPAGTDPDYLMLTVHGWDSSNQPTGTVQFPLADFRFSPDTDYILGLWHWLDLTSLGDRVQRLSFSMQTTDVGEFGPNTPTYFAMDNLTLQTVPEPAGMTVALVVTMPLLLDVRRRRKV